MTNTEKLKNLMKEYGVKKCYYSHNMNLDDKRPNSDIFWLVKKWWSCNCSLYDFYRGWYCWWRSDVIDSCFSEDSESFKIKIEPDMKVLYANI